MSDFMRDEELDALVRELNRCNPDPAASSRPAGADSTAGGAPAVESAPAGREEAAGSGLPRLSSRTSASSSSSRMKSLMPPSYPQLRPAAAAVREGIETEKDPSRLKAGEARGGATGRCAAEARSARGVDRRPLVVYKVCPPPRAGLLFEGRTKQAVALRSGG